jgi:hypothetical protein
MTRSGRLLPVVFLLMLFASACDESTPTDPSSGAVVTISVANESFRVWLTDEQQIAAARAAQNGGSARIPNGRIVQGTQVNLGWSWHLSRT